MRPISNVDGSLFVALVLEITFLMYNLYPINICRNERYACGGRFPLKLEV
jgi:hypothetical protein